MKESLQRLTVLNSVLTFTKRITITWLFLWVETVLFSELAVLFNFGDATAISSINENVLQIGLVVCGFYFSTKCIENVAKGIETFYLTKGGHIEFDTIEESSDDTDSDEEAVG